MEKIANGVSLSDSEKGFRLIVNHYAKWFQIVTGTACALLVIAPFFSPFIILLDFILFPAMLFLFLKATMDKTDFKIEDGMLFIKKRKSLMSEDNKILVSNVVKVFEGEQAYSDKQTAGNFGGYTMVTAKSMYTKPVVAIKTNKRVLRLGQEFSDKNVRIALDILKKKLNN